MSTSSEQNVVAINIVAIKETWPIDGSDTFGYPPLETARNGIVMPGRGVLFANVLQGLYIERDGYTLRAKRPNENLCAESGEPPELGELVKQTVYKSTP